MGGLSRAERAYELEPRRDWDEEATPRSGISEMRRRFEELQPDATGQIYVQDYRITLLFEALSKSSSAVIDLFRSIDQDGSMTNIGRVCQCSPPARLQHSIADVDVVFGHLDGDNSGLVDYVELNAKLRPKACRHRRSDCARRCSSSAAAIGSPGWLAAAELERGKGDIAMQLHDLLAKNFLRVFDLFQKWDEDHSGDVDRTEFAQCITALGYDAPHEEVMKLFDSFDLDGSGMISQDELYRKLRKGAQKKKSLAGRAAAPRPIPAAALAEARRPPPPRSHWRTADFVHTHRRRRPHTRTRHRLLPSSQPLLRRRRSGRNL